MTKAIVLKVKTLENLKEKSVGLIGKKVVYPVHFTTRWGIHTFGVLSPIDVLILDKNKRVVKIKQNLKPNRVFFWNPIYKNVVELPLGTIREKKIKIGDQIIFGG